LVDPTSPGGQEALAFVRERRPDREPEPLLLSSRDAKRLASLRRRQKACNEISLPFGEMNG